MTREQALRSYTLDAAFGAFEEKSKGSIEPGKLADFTVFTKDLMTIPENQILQTEVSMTILGGKVVYQTTLKRKKGRCKFLPFIFHRLASYAFKNFIALSFTISRSAVMVGSL